MTQLAAFVILISGVVCAAASEIVIKRYVVQDGNVCIVAQLAATFFIDYTDVKGVTQTSTLEVGDNAVVQNSSNECADQVMALKFENDRYFSMQFSLNESTSETCVTKITLYTKIDSVTFPGHDSIGKNETIVFSDKSFCTGMCRKCIICREQSQGLFSIVYEITFHLRLTCCLSGLTFPSACLQISTNRTPAIPARD